MADLMPTSVQCCRCSRQFPVRAQMQVEGKVLPMLVVPEEVDSMEAAIAQATCQVCLQKSGPAERGLHEVLKALGLKDEEDEAPPPREATVVVHVREERTVSTVGVAISDSRPREVVMVDPLMGTSIQVTRLELPARQRGRGQRHNDWHQPASEPRVPRALRQPERHEPLPKVEPLTGAIRESGGNAAVLEAVQTAIRQRDEAKRLERVEKFDKLMFWLRLTLAKIRKNAGEREIWDLVETFERKVWEATDLNSRGGMNTVRASVGTSTEELEELCLKYYLQKVPLRIRRPVEIVQLDAFESGRRPEFWDAKGGRSPAFYEFEVVRTKSSLPVPNPPLPGGDEDPRPRIVYPQDGQYGPDYTVEHSRHLAGVEDKIDAIVGELASLYNRWLAIARDDIGIETEMSRIDLATHIPAFFRDLSQVLADETAELAAEKVDQVESPTITTSPELPATT